MWKFVEFEEGGFQTHFTDGSAISFTPDEMVDEAARYCHVAINHRWPQEDAGVFIENPLAAAFHDLYKFMTPEGSKAYESIPDMLKWNEFNPYIHQCLATVGLIREVGLLSAMSPELWSGYLTVAEALDETDALLPGGFEAKWAELTAILSAAMSP